MPAPRMLLPLPVPAGPAVLGLLPLLAGALSGQASAALHPHAVGEAPHPALRTGEPLFEGEDDDRDPTAVVVATSGSTGTPKGALLPAGALRASADATAAHLATLDPTRPADREQWVLALPAQHIAGLQVLLRSIRAGTEPVVLDPRDTIGTGGSGAVAFVRAFVAATAACTASRLLTALVPTQLGRLLDAGEEATAALAAHAAVLVGAAATPAPLLARARAAGVRIVTTYGMSETCGGCVYDGVPLRGVVPEVDGTGRLLLAGAVVARGYRARPGHPAFDLHPAAVRRFRTDDAAVLHEGRVRVTGRLDDLVVTGGLKIAPGLVEDALTGQPGIAEVVVVGVEDPEWGQRVVAVVVPPDPGTAPTLEAVRRRVAAVVAPQAAPRQLLVLQRLPLRGPGKPDRARLRELARQAVASPG
ncbi:MAG: AMP-binding protein [Janthinobacterium lividum]